MIVGNANHLCDEPAGKRNFLAAMIVGNTVTALLSIYHLRSPIKISNAYGGEEHTLRPERATKQLTTCALLRIHPVHN